VSHAGLGVMILGIVGTQLINTEYDLVLRKNETAAIRDYELQLVDITPGQGKNYFYDEAWVNILKDEKQIGQLRPSKRYYPTGNHLTSEVAIAPIGLGDIYLVMGDYNKNDARWSFRAYHHPLVVFLWLGMAMIAAGGGIAIAGGIHKNA
ncbi:MAG TPA: hypothetical protein DIS76_04650, partial [Rhodospirillaceae bacterium]|nr:hypothetical protein [Rhodospirillaceae bacterium]